METPHSHEVTEVMDAMRKLIRFKPDAAIEMTHKLEELLPVMLETAIMSAQLIGGDPYPEGSFRAFFSKYLDDASWMMNSQN